MIYGSRLIKVIEGQMQEENNLVFIATIQISFSVYP